MDSMLTGCDTLVWSLALKKAHCMFWIPGLPILEMCFALYICSCACMCVGANVHVCKGKPIVIPQEPSTFSLEVESLTGAWVDWLASEPKGPLFLCLPELELQGHASSMGAGDWTWVLMLVWQIHCNWALSLAPSNVPYSERLLWILCI